MLNYKDIMLKIRYIITLLLITFIYTQPGGGNWKPVGFVRGTIIDDLTELPKEYASISIIAKETNDEEQPNIDEENDIVAGGISDVDGKFLISDVPFGYYEVIIEYIGYEKYIVDKIAIHPPNNITIDLGEVRIKPKTLLLDDVSVSEAAIIEEVAKTIYPVQEIASESGGSADEVLEQLPGLSVDMDGNITLRGNSNVTILIDGRKSKIDLDMLNANMIDKVEVMTTPSAKYDPDGMAGIINIILLKNQFAGKTGKVGLNVDQYEGFNLSGSYNIFKNDFNLFTSYSHKVKNKQGKGYRKTIYMHQPNPDDYSWFANMPNVIVDYSEMNTDYYRHPESSNLKMGLEKYLNDKAMIAFDVTYIYHQGIDTSYISLYSKEINNPSMISNITTINEEEGADFNYGFGYFIDDQDKETSFSLQIDYDDYDEKENIKYIESGLETFTKDIGQTAKLMIDYSGPLSLFFPLINEPDHRKADYNKKSIVELGLKLEKDDDLYDLDIDSSPFIYNYKNKINSAYFNVPYYLTESFGIQIGARIENQKKEFAIDFQNLTCNEDMCINFNEFLSETGVTNSTVFSYKHERVYPSLYFIYNTPKGTTFKFGAGRRINRPGHWNLNPVPDLEDFNTGFVNVGDPSLSPEDILKAEFSFSGVTPVGFLKATIYADKVKDGIDRDKDLINLNGEEYQILSWNNLGETKGKGFDITFVTQPLPSWNLMLYGNYWDKNTTVGDEIDQIGKEFGFWGMMTSKIKLNDKQQISIYAHHSSPMNLTTGMISPFKIMDISYKRKVSKKFNFTLKLKDVFDSGGFSIMTDQTQELEGEYYADPVNNFPNGYTAEYDVLQEYLDADHRRNRRTISLNFEYKFGEFEENKKYRREESGYDRGGGGGGMDQGF